MGLNNINSLKQKGNDAFKLGNLEEALEHYTEAIEMLGTDGDKKITAIILSNRAQLYLKMEKYQQALKDADNSLQYDPSFIKSIFRRAIANAELGNNNEAMTDLRKMFALEPGNSTVRSLLKRVSGPVKMNSQLRDACVGHYFRRWMTDRRRMASEPWGSCDYIRIPILRQSFLSVENSMSMRQVLNGSTVASDPLGILFVSLSCWLLSKRMRVDVRPVMLHFEISCATLSTLYCVIRPVINLSILTGDGGLGHQFGSMHKCKEVYHLIDIHVHPLYIDPTDIRVIEEASRILTRLQYFAEIVKFKDKTFPMVNTLMIESTQIVDMEFLKLWKRQQWGIKNIIALGDAPNLLNFELFKGIISNHVTHVWMDISHLNQDNFPAEDDMKQFKNKMQTLKRVFPLLNSITVDLNVKYPLRDFPNIFHDVKRHIFYLTDNFVRRLKPGWCREFRVIVRSMGAFELGGSPVPINLQPLEDLVTECRGEMKQLKYIRSRGPTPQKVPGITMPCFAAIEMATDDAEFQNVLALGPVRYKLI